MIYKHQVILIIWWVNYAPTTRYILTGTSSTLSDKVISWSGLYSHLKAVPFVILVILVIISTFRIVDFEPVSSSFK